VALDTITGDVRAMVGGRDFRQSKFNRATQSLRQAGSSFKPFVYASAIASGIPPSHILVDAPVVMPQVSGEEWKPQNFSPEFQGPITIREGLRRSINMIAIKLGMDVGLETVAQTASRMGIRTPIERFPSTTIGAAEVVPIQMAEAYLKDKKRLLPCAAYLSGEYGVDGSYIGVPIILGEGGVERIVEIELQGEEKEGFQKSLEAVNSLIDAVKKLAPELAD